jgi:hypothetical protein
VIPRPPPIDVFDERPPDTRWVRLDGPAILEREATRGYVENFGARETVRRYAAEQQRDSKEHPAEIVAARSSAAQPARSDANPH